MARRTNMSTGQDFSVDPTDRNLTVDFDRWAAEVRQQMLAALRKRNANSEDID